jgi:hypothetical protein
MLEVGGFEGNGTHVYLSAGFDWQAKNGFNFGMGINKSLRSAIGQSAFINLGWFFNFLG